jgi:endo-1,4-beta-xylanase
MIAMGTGAALSEIAEAQSRRPALKDVAAARHIAFGAEITVKDIADPDYAALVGRECSSITPGVEGKWAYVEPVEGVFRFGPMDALAGFAQHAGLSIHMHNLIWAVGLPDWTTRALEAGRGREIVQRHADAIGQRYGNRIGSWDVVNEPADPRWPSGPEGLCTTPWRRFMGPDFIATSLYLAAAAAPAARLMINDHTLEYDAPDRARKRLIYLRLVESLLRKGAPLHGFGLESHLKPWLPVAERQFRQFLKDLADFGLELFVTELDVCDRYLPSDNAVRDAMCADFARRYLDLVLDEAAVSTVIVWGLSDRNSWMATDTERKRLDGRASRPCAYDTQLRAKPMRDAIARALAGARDRPDRRAVRSRNHGAGARPAHGGDEPE